MKRRPPPSAQAWLDAITNSQPTRPSEVTRIMVRVRTAYERLKSGAGTPEDYDWVGAAINVGLIRAESIGQALVDAFKDAGEAMLECARIQQRHGKFGFTGPHILAMNEVMDLYQDVLSMSSPLQMHRAAEESARRIRQGEYISA